MNQLLHNTKKSLFHILGLVILLFVLGISNSKAQVSLTATAGTSSGTFTTIKAAFDAINLGTHQGNIAITLTGNTTETSSAILNASGSGSANYVTISIQPSGGVPRSISGNLASPLIDLNGADSVMIDGLNVGGNALVISNASTSNITNTSTIRFINDASNNTITNTSIKGSSTSSTLGTVFFSTASVAGNDNNILSNNRISEEGANLPIFGVYCSGSVGFENSGVLISNNEIANFYSASLPSTGVFVSSGATNWTVTGNKIYQSGTRNYTTANTHRGVHIATGNGHVISNNTIGYANASGTGTYTITSTVATLFVGIEVTVGAIQTTTIDGNTISNFNMTSSSGASTGAGVLCGIRTGGGNVNIGSLSGNIIGATSGTASLVLSTTTATGAIVGINAASTGNTIIQNNVFGALQSIGSPNTLASAVFGITISVLPSTLSILNNTIGNSTSNNIVAGILGTTTGITQVTGIVTPLTMTVSNTININGNTIQNLASYGSGSSFVRGVATTSITVAPGTLTINNNTITNLTTNSSLAGISSGLAAAVGITVCQGTGTQVLENTISNISALNTTINAVNVCGILTAGISTLTIARNRIFNLSNAATGNTSLIPGIVAGIAIRSATLDLNILNNMIALGSGQTTNTSFVGIYCQNGSSPNPNLNILNNTIHITGIAGSGTQPTFGFLRGDLSATAARTTTVLLRNNIISNQRTGGSGRHFAIANNFLATGAASRTGWATNASNNNILLASNSDSLGYWTRGGNFQRWKDSSLCEANSFASGPIVFIDSTSDLHLNLGATPTFAESNGTTLTQLNTDFDSQTRPGPTGSVNGGAVLSDIGADEFDGVPIDGSAPLISYTLLGNSNSLSNITLTNFATIADVALDNTAGNKPRLFYKKASEANAFVGNTTLDNGWKNVEATNASSPFSFTVDYSLLTSGSVTVGDTIQYFVVAQDLIPLLTANPAIGFVGTAVDTISMAPTTPNKYIIVDAPLSGNYNIGAGQIFTSVSQAVNNLSLRGVSGPVTFTLKDLVYDSLTTSEVFPIVLSPYVGSSSINTVTIMPDLGVAATIAAAHSAAFELNGGDNYIFDGRQGGVGSFVPGSSLIISNANNPAIRLLNDATANTIKYCDLRSNNNIAAGTAGAGVVNFGTTTGANGNDSNSIKYCDIHDAGLNLLAVGISSIGSATTVASNNDANVVDSNNVYDYCNVSNATAAVYIGANNSTWQINGNRFYQTVARTFTGTSHRVLWITPNTANLTSASGFTINNNFIGGNAANGSGMYDLDGNNAAFVFAVMDISVGLGAATTIQNNTITNILDSTTSTAANAFVAINMVNGNVNCGTIAGNLIGSRVTNGAINFMAMSPTIGGLMGFRTGGGTGNTFNISNNIVSGITLDASIATASPEFMGFNLFNATTVNATNNMVGDTMLPNSIHILSTSASSVSAQRVAGFFVNPSGGTPVFTISNNTIANITNNYSATGSHAASTKGIACIPTITGTYTVNNNVVKNIATASATTGTGINSTLVGIGISQTVGTVSATGNIVHSLTLTSASTTAAARNTGIFYTSSTTGTNLLARNFTHSKSLVANNPFAVITGIELGTGNNIVVNNMVREGFDSTGAAITTACGIRGIVKNTGSNQVYFNTVFIGGSNVGADNSQTYAFIRTGAGTDVVNNNIFYNTRSNSSSGAGHFAVGLNNNTTLTMNYNLLKADTIGVFGVTSYLAIPNWKVGSGVDANSISSPLSFVNAAGDKNNVNLRLDTLVATPTEAYGIAIAATGVDVDFDGQTRSSLTPVDLGAHAGNFIPSDIAAPNITYTAFTNTLATGDRTLIATITDATGVYVSGAFRPRVYFKKMFAGSWNSDIGTLTSGTAANGTWTFTINALTMGGLVGDDSVYYYVVAQDSTAFNTLGSFPGGVEGTDVNSITVTPTPLSYKISPILSGTLLVGAGQTFTTLTATTGLFNYLNSAVIGGNLTVQITSDIEEPGTVGLNETIETGLGGYTINIVPDAAVLRSIAGTHIVSRTGLIRLNGADRVKIDGSFGGSGRFIRILNRAQIGTTIDFLNDADNDTIANILVQGTNNTDGMVNFFSSTKVGGTGNDSNAVIGCVFSDTTGTLPTDNIPNTGLFSQGALGNDYNTISNNEIYNFGFNGIHLSSTGGDFWTIADNKFYQTIVKNNGFVVITVLGGSGHSITGNSIGGSNAIRGDSAFRTTSTFTGINLASAALGGIPSTISNNSISNIATTSTLKGIGITTVLAASTPVTITNNYISNITPTTGASFGMELLGGTLTVGNNTLDSMVTGTTNGAIHFGGGAGTSAIIENNSISNLRYNGTGTLRTAGISVSTTTATSILIRNNTIRNISGDNLGTATTSVRLGGIVVISAPLSGLVISDNIISNIRSTNLGTAAYAPVGIHVTGTTASYSILRNRISNIVTLGTGVGTAAPIAMGIQLASSSTNCTVANNQVSLGDSALNESRVMALSDYSSGSNTFSYNSVFVNGTTAAGINHSYGFYRNLSTSNVNFRNNIIYNKRTTLGSGNNYAVGALSATLISGANINYNLFVVNDTNKLAELPTGISNGWSQLNALYTTSPNTNWATNTSEVTANSLFTDTLIGNLGIVTTNPQAWYANGKGRAMATISGDYTTASGVRSTTIATGSTDIGSVEFTPSSIPPVAAASNIPASGDSTNYTFASRKIAQLNWDVIGSVPTSVDVRYYSGVNPANTIPGSSFLNAYYDVQPTGGSGFKYALTLMHDSAIMGNITSLTNLQVARYRASATNWINYTTSTVDTVRGFFANNFMISDSMGVFTGTDGATNPLPVTLTSFTVLAKAKDANLIWTTASEINNKGFEIERSVDGKTFEKVAFVKGAGNSNVKMNYALTDAKAFVVANSNVLYYRLKQVDFNGTATYSKIVKVSITAENVNSVLAYPNPFTTDYSVSFTAAKAGVANMELVTILGSTVSSVTTDITAGNNVLQINTVANLETGIYFVKLTVNGETQVIKLVKN